MPCYFCVRLQLKPTKNPGSFEAVAVVDSVMRRFELRVPRTFYVDDSEERDTRHGRRVQKTLPRMRPQAFLYEFSVDESSFLAKLK